MLFVTLNKALLSLVNANTLIKNDKSRKTEDIFCFVSMRNKYYPLFNNIAIDDIHVMI